MNPIPPQYRILALGAALIVCLLGGYFYGTAHEARVWKAAIAEQKAEAARALNEANDKAAKENERHAQIARDTDAMYIAMVNDATAGRDAFAERLRIARRGQSCGGKLPSPAPVAGKPEGATTGGDGGPRKPDPVVALRNAVVNLQTFARVCQGWAVQVGR